MCRPLGVTLLAGVHLTHPATDGQKAMQLYTSCNKHSLKTLIRRAYWHAFWGKMRLQLPAFEADLTPICDKNPLDGCFIAADGSVAPCVFLYPPLSDAESTKHTTKNSHLQVSRKRFGSLHHEWLDQIWQKNEYRMVREAFHRRITVYGKELGRVGYGMDAFAKLDCARNRIREVLADNPVPNCCRGCPKMESF